MSRHRRPVKATPAMSRYPFQEISCLLALFFCETDPYGI